MNFDNLPKHFRRIDDCNICGKEAVMYEIFLDDRGVVTRFKCSSCGHVSGMIYSGRHIEAYKEAQTKEQELKEKEQTLPKLQDNNVRSES